MREPTIPLGDAMRAEHAQTEAHAAELRRRAEAEARRAEAFGVAGPASTPERAGLPCPTCGGKRWLRAPVPHDEVLPGRSCPDCSDGVWTPPDSPVPIGVTSEYLRNSARYGPWIVRQPVTGLRMDCVTEPWTMFDPRVNGSGINIAQSSVIGEATLRPLKVVEADADGHGAVVEMRPDGSLWFWPEGAFGEDAATDISSALPFLPGLKPEDTVYLLDGFTGPANHDRDHDFRFPKSDPKRP